VFLLIIIAVVPLVLFCIWKLRYRYPSPALPQVLCYHKITARFSLEGTWLSPRRFTGHIDSLLERGYSFIDETSFLAALDDPGQLDSKKLLLTFDDGYRESIPHVFDELEKRRIPSLIFLVAGCAGRRNRWDLTFGRRSAVHMSWGETRDLQRRGVSFGSHGLTHADLTMLPPEARREELVRSKQLIESELDCEVRSLSYPFGRYNEAVKSAAADAGYAAGFSLYPALRNDRIDRYALRRNGVYVIDTRGALRRKLEPGKLFWFEEMKCRTINGIAVITPLVKRLSARPGS
jgi:peptidoglycan/xylan/chitin deacetylase (PgdA/CDA1 family)